MNHQNQIWQILDEYRLDFEEWLPQLEIIALNGTNNPNQPILGKIKLIDLLKTLKTDLKEYERLIQEISQKKQRDEFQPIADQLKEKISKIERRVLNAV